MRSILSFPVNQEGTSNLRHYSRADLGFGLLIPFFPVGVGVCPKARLCEEPGYRGFMEPLFVEDLPGC